MRYRPPDGYHSANHHKYTRRNPVAAVHLARFADLMARRIRPFAPATLLDAGCGEGFATDGLARRLPGVSATGVDVSAPAVAFARERFGAGLRGGVYETGSLYALPYPDRAFDAVVCSEVLEHLDAPDRAFAEVLRVARRVLVVTVPREPLFRRLNDLGQALGFAPDPGHVNFWTPRQFDRFVRDVAPNARVERHSLYQIATIPVSAQGRG